MGSDHLKAINKHISRGKVFIIDHHQIPTDLKTDVANILNPMFFGLDGSIIGCASVLTSLLTYFAVKEEDPYYLKLGLIGAVGDLQNEVKGSVNEFLLNEGIKRGVFKKYKTFSFFKLVNSPIHKGICWNFTPYIPGLTGREDVVVSLLTSANIRLKENGKWRKIRDLSDDEKKAITDRIIEYLVHKSGLINVKTSDFLETVHEFKDEDHELLSTAEGFSSTLNACGKMNKEYLALVVSMGVRSKDLLKEIKKTVEERRISLKNQMEMLAGREKISNELLVVDGREILDEKFTGSISTMYSRSPAFRGKVILIVTETARKEMKVSVRAPRNLVSKGLNLGKVMYEVGRSIGGVGGGHNIAAGATLPISGKTYAHLKDLVITMMLREIKKVESRG